MNSFQRISVDQARQLIAAGDLAVVDVRDAMAYNQGHIEGAMLLDNQNIHPFMDQTDKATAVLIYCYHGNSSQSAAQFLADQGFQQVYSMDGGYEAWRIR